MNCTTEYTKPSFIFQKEYLSGFKNDEYIKVMNDNALDSVLLLLYALGMFKSRMCACTNTSGKESWFTYLFDFSALVDRYLLIFSDIESFF